MANTKAKTADAPAKKRQANKRASRDGLSPADRDFAEYYLKDPNRNQTEAWMQSHPRARSREAASVSATRAMQRPEVQAYIKQREAAIAATLKDRTDIDVADVVRDLLELRDMCMGRAPIKETVLGEDGKPIKDGDGNPIVLQFLRVDLREARGTLELLGKYKKMFTDKIEHGGEVKGAGVLVVPGMQSPDQWKKKGTG